jgi:hypothetical protein
MKTLTQLTRSNPANLAPLVSALKAHYFDVASREQSGATPALSAELDATQRLILLLDSPVNPSAPAWRLEPLSEGWHWMREPGKDAVIVLVGKIGDEIVVRLAGQPYQLSLLPGFQFSGPLTPPA